MDVNLKLENGVEVVKLSEGNMPMEAVYEGTHFYFVNWYTNPYGDIVYILYSDIRDGFKPILKIRQSSILNALNNK